MNARRLEIQNFGGPDVIRLVTDTQLPEPGPGEVRIRAEASSLTFTDTLIRRNLYPVIKPNLPLTLGYDLVGYVDSVGPGVNQWRVGDRVADLTQIGGNSCYQLRPASTLVAVPPGIAATQAEPLILSYVTAYQALFREAGASPGDSVLIYGASGAVGMAALDLCRAFGLAAVGVASARHERAVVRLGAAFVPYDEAHAAKKLDDLSREFNGFRVVIDMARGEMLSSVMTRLSPEGHLVAIGFSAPFRAACKFGNPQPGARARTRMAIDYLHLKWRSMQSHTSGKISLYNISESRSAHPEWFQSDLAKLFALLEAGRIEPHIPRIFGLEDAHEAHRLIESGDVEGRFVLDLS